MEAGRVKKAYIVTELAELGSLRKLATSFANQPELALTAFRRMCEAVAYAHSQEVVHRDLHPGNVVFASNLQKPKIIDFGICIAREDLEGERTTESGETLGDPDFAPPEFRKGRVEDLNEQADVYSLGAMLYFMLSGGKKAVHGNFNDPSLEELWNHPRYIPISKEVLRKTLAYRVEDRFQTVEELKAVASTILEPQSHPEQVTAYSPEIPSTPVETGPLPGNIVRCDWNAKVLPTLVRTYFRDGFASCPDDDAQLFISRKPGMSRAATLLIRCPNCGKSATYVGKAGNTIFTPDQLNVIRKAYFSEGDSRCPGDGSILIINEVGGRGKAGKGILAICPYCGTQGTDR